MTPFTLLVTPVEVQDSLTSGGGDQDSDLRPVTLGGGVTPDDMLPTFGDG